MTNDDTLPRSPGGQTPTENASASIQSGNNVTDLPAVKAVGPDGGDGDIPCDICRSTGLVILPVRYTVVPASCPGAGLGSLPRGRACKEDVSAAGYEYALRTLRQGMLYLFYEQSGPYGPRQWEAYAVAENGTLWRQPSAHAARSIQGGGLPACSRSSHNAERMEFITVQRPHQCGTVWMAFSEHLWTPATLDRYASDPTLRAERMQPITPGEWIGTPKAREDAAPLAGADGLKAVMEYRGFEEAIGEPVELPHQQRPEEISNADGSHKDVVLKRNATRYRWSLRTHASNGPSGEAALQQRYALMQSFSHNGQQGDKRKAYTPMLLGLWDAVGVAHELNGYRHDVVGAMARYNEERAMERNAMEHIEEIDTLLQRNAGVLSDQYARASRARMEEIEQDLKQSSSNPVVRAGMEQMRAHGLESSNEATWDSLSKALLPLYQREAREKWEKTYWPMIDEPAYTLFKENAGKFAEAAMELLAPRTQLLGKWLSNELFLATLEDYDGTSPECGVRFEDAVTTAVEGLGMDALGRKLLQDMASDLNVTGRSCLLWRVVAQNQDGAREELQQVLGEADSLKDTVLSASGAAWNTFVTTSKTLKKFMGVYKGFDAVQKKVGPLTPTDRMLRDSGVDRFITTAGAFLLNSFPLNGLQDKVGNGLVRFVLMTRGLMDEAEASNLINLEASTAVGVRNYFLQQVKHYQGQKLTAGTPMMYALRDVERHHGTELMRQRWARASEGSRNAMRLGALTGVLELVNFINLLNKADKQARDYGSLVASGASLVAVYTSMSEKVSTEFFGGTSRSAAKMKAIGGWLGGFGTYIGVYYDVGTTLARTERNNWSEALLYAVKTGAGAVVGASQFLTALIFSAPLIEKALGRRGVVIWLDAAKAGIQAAAAKEGAEILAKASMKRLGVWMLRLGSWEVTVALLAIDVLIYVVEPDALEKWCQSNRFGKIDEGGWLGFGASAPRYKTLKEQDEKFHGAMGEVSARGV
ncbi:T6SS effector BTH_I2691 family protein [Stenotrophomonas tumulicola]|uniref:T6SS effector BTH_I2691 family protein n=1 Tax=Stenotrophomonas tumulicola TaxID=1685415 RepID=UPI001FEA61DB|nr:T6SS effector BTH_I2691 family protein [Stenotrophomonas tumulicola]